MKSFILTSLWVVILLNSSESRTWRPRSSLVASPKLSQSGPASTFFVRGGGDGTGPVDGVPQVPTGPILSNLQHNVARGGSTRTTPHPSSSSMMTTSIPSHVYQTESQEQQEEEQKQGLEDKSVSQHEEQSASDITDYSFSTENTNLTTTEPESSLSEKEIKAEEKARKKQEKKELKLEKKELKRHKAIAKKLKNRNATNIRRKVMHASFGFFFAALNHFIPKAKFVPGMAILTTATLTMELLRYRKGFHWMNEILHFVLGSSLRKHEMDGKFTGSFYYFLGVTLTAAIYPTSCATLGICQLAVADPTASYFGRATRHVYWSRIENGFGGLGRNKGILGFIGGGLACVPMNYYLLSMAQFATPVSKSSLWLASFALGFAGAFADLAVPTPALTLPKRVCGVRVPPFHLDDNVVVPIASGWACTKVYRMLSFPPNLALAKYLLL